MEGKRKSNPLDGLFGLDVLGETPDARPAHRPTKTDALDKSTADKGPKADKPETTKPETTTKEEDSITKKEAEIRKEYKHKTKSASANIRKVVSLILGAATAGLVGLDYAYKANVMRDLIATAQYNAQLVELQKQAIEAMHQGALGMLEVGNPTLDNGNIMSHYFPEFNGKFNQFAQDNPELASKINDSLNSYLGNPDVMNEYAQSRGFESFEAFMNWGQANFGHMFNADGTLASDVTMQQLDQYYMTGLDIYNYLGQLAIQENSEEILMAGVNAQDLIGIDIIPQEITDEAGNVVGSILTTQISPDAIQSSAPDIDPTFMVGAAAVTAIAGIGAYCISDKVISHFSKGSDEKDSSITK